MLDFVGILLIGWALINLPRIIKGLRGLINLIRKVTGILGSFINTIKDIVVGIGSIITDAISKFPTFDFEKNKRGIEENLDKASGGLFKLDQQLVQSGNDFTEFGDELDIQYEQELKDAENEGSVEGTPSTSDGVTNEQNEETIKGYKEQIGFNVDSITKDNRQQNEEEAKDPIDNIKPRKNSSENLNIDQSKLDPKKIIDDEINKIDVDGEEIAKKETDNQIKGKQTNDPETSPLIHAINNKRSPKLTDARNQLTNIKKNVVDEVSSLTNEYKTDFEGGEGGKRKINLSSLLAPTKKDVNVKSKKKKGDTIFIIEKKVSNDNMQPAMANTGRRGLNNLGEFDNSNETLVKLQSTSLKYT